MQAKRNRSTQQEFCPRGVAYLTYQVAVIRLALWKGISEFSPRFRGRFLDFGCGKMPYRPLYHVDEYIGIDIAVSGHSGESKLADVLYDGKVMPFRDESFDGIMATEVLEHLFEPDATLRDFYRVLRPEGLLLLTTPFAWPEHEAPFDYCRYSRFGLRALLEKAGFEVLEERKYGGGWRAQCQLRLNYWFAKLSTWPRPVRKVAKGLVTAWFNTLALLGATEPCNPNEEFFLSHVFLAQKAS